MPVRPGVISEVKFELDHKRNSPGKEGRALQRPTYFTIKDQPVQTFKYLLCTSNYMIQCGGPTG